MMYSSSQNFLLSFLLVTTIMAANISARKASTRDYSFHENDNNKNKHGVQAEEVKRNTCQKDCQDNKEMCLNHIGVTNFSEKFVCLAQYGLCKKKCISNDKLPDEDEEKVTSSSSDSKRNIESNGQRNFQANNGKKIVIDEKILRQLYGSMPKELLIDLLLLEQHSSSDA